MIHVLGSINIDYSCSVGHLPRPGETIVGKSLFTTPGGKGANQAIAARRAGSPVTIIGAIGSDEVAEQALACLTEDGVDISQVKKVPGPTGCAFVFVDAASENQIVIVPGANAGVDEAQAREMAIEPGDVLLLQLEVPVSTVVAAADHASKRGATVVANLAPYQQLPAACFDNIDILLVNETEAGLLAADLNIESSGDNLAAGIAEHINATVVLTLGARGVIAVNKDQTLAISGVSVNSVDTVGAGDTFAGYLGAMLERSEPLQRACEIANSAAALACTKPGAQTAMPLMSELNINGV
jgi:ribokinase